MAADAAMGVTVTVWHLITSVAGLTLAGVAIVTWGTPAERESRVLGNWGRAWAQEGNLGLDSMIPQ